MFERFTQDAKRAVTLAEEEAIESGYDFIDTGHLLLGLIRIEGGIAGTVLHEHGVTAQSARQETTRQLDADGRKPDRGAGATNALAAIGIDVDEIRRLAEDTFGPDRFRFPRPSFTPRLKTTMAVTLYEARDLGQEERIDTEHLLLGLLKDGTRTDTGERPSVAVRVLTWLRADPAELRTDTLAKITEN